MLWSDSDAFVAQSRERACEEFVANRTASVRIAHTMLPFFPRSVVLTLTCYVQAVVKAFVREAL